MIELLKQYGEEERAFALCMLLCDKDNLINNAKCFVFTLVMGPSCALKCQQRRKNSPQRNQVVLATEDHGSSWFKRIKTNIPQSNSVGAASFVFISGGLNIAWSCGCPLFTDDIEDHERSSLHIRISWVLSAIVGSVAGAILTSRMPMKYLFTFCATLVVIGGIILVCGTRNIIVARYLNGFANGVTFAPALCVSGEVTVSSMRGVITTTIEQMSFNAGVCLQLLCVAIWQSDWTSNLTMVQFHGTLCICLGTVALLFAQLLTIESSVYYLLRNREQEAVESLRRLQRPHMVTNETFKQLNDHKSYLACNKEITLGRGALQGLSAAIRLCMYRALNGMSLTLVVYGYFVLGLRQTNSWPVAIFGGLRWLGSFLAIFLMDNSGRKKATLFNFLISGALSMAYAVFLDTEHYKTTDLITTLALLYQFFFGLANTASSAYLSEAFPLQIKPFYITLAFIVELLVRLAFAIELSNCHDAVLYFYVLGTLSIGFFLLGIFCLPETKLTNLTTAQTKFRKVFNKDF